MMSCLRICVFVSNLYLECGATFDILKNAKKAKRKATLNKMGSSRILQAREIAASVVRSNMPLGVGKEVELIAKLLRYA